MNFAARVTGTGSAFPKNRMSNAGIVKRLAKLGVQTSDTWIRERTGIRERRVSDVENPAEQNSSLGFSAAQNALKMAEKSAEDIDQIIYATCSPDTLLPSTACWLQHKLGASKAWAMDINAACSGFIYGLATADKFIQTGQVKTSLVVAGEVLSPLVNWEDRTTCILFGDGAGAAVVERVPSDSTHRILSSQLLSNGNLWDFIWVPAGGSNMEVNPERYSRKLHKIKMKGRELFKVAVKTLADFALQTLDKNLMTIDDLDWFVPHQANLRIIEAVVKRIKLPMERALINVDRYGNTSAATIPTALDEAARDGRIKSGQTVLLDAFGAGLTYEF
ncbi:MAG: beta-ketoacyl-ACP synthase III [Desulfobacterales bacterium]